MKLLKTKSIIIFLILVSNKAFAETCPDIQTFDPLHPPAGWTLNVPPIIEDQSYYFGEAIHSLNGSFYFKQVICKYQACDSAFCPAFSLLSKGQYAYPNAKISPWDVVSRIAYTFTCHPIDHDPSKCNFQ